MNIVFIPNMERWQSLADCACLENRMAPKTCHEGSNPSRSAIFGCVVQRLGRYVDIVEIVGSSPTVPTIGHFAQSGREQQAHNLPTKVHRSFKSNSAHHCFTGQRPTRIRWGRTTNGELRFPVPRTKLYTRVSRVAKAPALHAGKSPWVRVPPRVPCSFTVS